MEAIAGNEGAGAPSSAGAGSGTDSAGTGTGGATSATGSTPASTTPASASASLERVAATAEAAPADPNAAVKPESATTSPAASTTGSEFHLPKTKEDYDRILNNARAKAASEVKERLGWAEKLDPEITREAYALAQQFHQNPAEFARQILKELSESEEAELVDPDPDYTSPDGKAKFYSDSAVKTLLQNMEKRLMKQFKPAMSMVEQQEQRERMAQITADAAEIAKQALAEVRQYPHYAKYEALIAAKLKSIDPATRRRIGSVAALHMAYQAVINEKSAEISKETETRIRDEFSRKAAGGPVIVPGDQSVPRKPVRDGDVDALAGRLGELAATGKFG